MLRKNILLLAMIFVFLLSGTCWAAEKPFGDVNSTQQAIDRLFANRALDPVEGIWVKDPGNIIAIAKASLCNIDKPEFKNCDYVGIMLKGKYAGGTYFRLNKTEYSFCFSGHGAGSGGNWKLLSSIILQFDGNQGYLADPAQSFVRIYPAP